jgi:DNA-binding CsgD family transcriptional regulator
MRVVDVELEPWQIVRFFRNPALFAFFLEERGVTMTPDHSIGLARAFTEMPDDELAQPIPAGRVPRRPGGERHDTEVLIRFVDEKQPRLSRRQQQVFDLCIRAGASLGECAAQLGIGRETVRTHLRSLRALVDRDTQRNAAMRGEG